MEKRLEVKSSIGARFVPGPCPGRLPGLRLLCLCACLCALCRPADANWNRSKCQPGKILFGCRLRSWDDGHLRLLEGFHTVQSCQTACCQSPACDAFWFLENMCVQVNCTMPGMCQANRTGSPDSVLVFLEKSKSTEHFLKHQTEGDAKTWLHKWLDWDISARGKKRLRRSLASGRVALLEGDLVAVPSGGQAASPPDSKSRGSRREAVSKDQALRSSVPDRPVPEDHPSQKEDSLENGQNPREPKAKSPFPPSSNNVTSPSDASGTGFLQVHPGTAAPAPSALATFSSPAVLGLTAVGKTEKPKQPDDALVHPHSSDVLPTVSPVKGRTTVRMEVATPVPSGVPTNGSIPALPTGAAASPSTTAPAPVIKELVVSAGDSVQVTLPKNEVLLNAFVLPEPPPRKASLGTPVSYEWELITHPKDYSGEMEGKRSHILKLSKLTVGLYEFKVIVDGENAHGEGYVNVTVNPKPRVNQPPVAVVSPQFQEISLPTISTVIDGSQSTDDDKIVSYHWEELKGPLREEKVSTDTAILTLTNLLPGNYTF
ncbi:PREDICTED: dyslexia-associated protein KIAA0319-like protein, partial [Tinamus guttatus]|uniref:dyslexia-associated protein KIAA0319-like protein n=1 Tax=Tinamus guttatus TaxID=94827 RepID=UPI00052EE581